MKTHDFKEILAKIDAIEPGAAPTEHERHKLQGYTVKALVGLIDVSENLSAQNQKLEVANFKLQRRIFWLTIVMGTLAVLTFLFDLLDFLKLV